MFIFPQTSYDAVFAEYSKDFQLRVETVLVKTKICDKENWTMEDMISVYDNAE